MQQLPRQRRRQRQLPSPGGFNFNFNTGVEDLPDQPADLIDPDNNPPDGGFGTAMLPGELGDGTFNTPTVVEAADTGPFFHNNSVSTIEDAVGFYNSDAFNDSPAGQALVSSDSGGIGIRLEATQVAAVAAFLRVLNALENVRGVVEFLTSSDAPTVSRLLVAAGEVSDGAEALRCGGLHPEAVRQLEETSALLEATPCYRQSGKPDRFGRSRTVRGTEKG